MECQAISLDDPAVYVALLASQYGFHSGSSFSSISTEKTSYHHVHTKCIHYMFGQREYNNSG